eukprot:COSAG04_NODE_91_length_26852_cov_8.609315_38_plen_169_part_00
MLCTRTPPLSHDRYGRVERALRAGRPRAPCARRTARPPRPAATRSARRSPPEPAHYRQLLAGLAGLLVLLEHLLRLDLLRLRSLILQPGSGSGQSSAQTSRRRHLGKHPRSRGPDGGSRRRHGWSQAAAALAPAAAARGLGPPTPQPLASPCTHDIQAIVSDQDARPR